MGNSPKPGYNSQGYSAIRQLSPPFARIRQVKATQQESVSPQKQFNQKTCRKGSKNRSGRFQVNLHCNGSRQVRSEGVMHVNYVLHIPDAHVVRDGLALLKVREAAYFLQAHDFWILLAGQSTP